jgi:hypothetical protein
MATLPLLPSNWASQCEIALLAASSNLLRHRGRHYDVVIVGMKGVVAHGCVCGSLALTIHEASQQRCVSVLS